MKLTIKEGNHYDNNIFSVRPHIFQKAFIKNVKFDNSCEYTLPAYSQQNVNKLFGGYFGFFAEHKYSARFGWRWSVADQKIELLAYVYDAGRRNWDDQMRFPVVAQISLDENVNCSIDILDDSYVFNVKGTDGATIGQQITVLHSKITFWGLTQSFYFGGETKAPHTMSVYM